MKNQNSLLIATAVVFSIFICTSASAKTAKDCKAEWQADKAGMQSRGVTQKAYIEQCKGGAEPKAAAPGCLPWRFSSLWGSMSIFMPEIFFAMGP